MIDCSKTENFLREKQRMCKQIRENCHVCPLGSANNGTGDLCSNFISLSPAKSIEIVQEWSDEHPQKTMLEDFLEKYPNAPLNENGSPKVCPYLVGYEDEGDCNRYGNCKICWDRPYEEDVE